MKLPKKIYHYTSAEGLHGILSSGTLHFTDSLFLNDRNERKNFYMTLERELRRWQPESALERERWETELRKRLYIRYFKGPETIFQKLTATDPAQEAAARYFVLSCSEESDSLPMWNYYTHSIHAAGYNIHFDTGQLLSQLRQHPAFLHFSGSAPLLYRRVTYDEKQKARDIGKLLERFSYRWDLCGGKKEQERLLQMLDKAFERLSLFYKDKAFAHEKEVRIVIASNNRTIHQPSAKKLTGGSYQFHKAQDTQIPCLALDVLEKGKAIAGVTAGPALDKQLAVNGVEYMLYYYGFPQTCKVSSVPLRY
ncbi:DUF2971 domain-containing protein [bacterium 210820-DFI.6.37]|nr:DUF2971 domain-containing protein [bacterium 210820-DFI.6.37]